MGYSAILHFLCAVNNVTNQHVLSCDPQDLERARQHHQHQLQIAQELQDRAAQGRASSNLGRFLSNHK